MNTSRSSVVAVPLLVLGAMLRAPGPAEAHCDGMDGPVVEAARSALTAGDVELALVWVQEGDEAEIREAFARTVAVRGLGEDARHLADRWFFETLVRVHRAGEGAAFTGLKPAGRDLGPAIPLADEALSSGALEPLLELLTEAIRHGLIERFHAVREARDYPAADVQAGRAFVRSYVAFIHYVERAYEAASRPAGGHFPEDGVAAGSPER